jgi:hypothetical protein
VVATLCVALALPAAAVKASSWYVENALTVPELGARPTIDGTAGATEWTSASGILNLSDYTGGGVPPADTSDFAAAFQMGTFQGDLYFVVYVSDNTPNFTARNHTADSCEFRINLTGTLVDVNLADALDDGSVNVRPAAPAGAEWQTNDWGTCFLNLGAGQIRGRGDGNLLIVGGDQTTINNIAKGSSADHPAANPALASVLNYTVGTAPASLPAPLANGRMFEFEIKVSQMNMKEPVSNPFGFGVAVNDSDADNVRVYQAAWHGGPQQPLGTTNAAINTDWNNSIGAIQPWRRMFVRAATVAQITQAAHPAVTGALGSGGGGGNECVVAGPDLAWMNTAVTPQTGDFTVEWDMTPSEAPLDGLFGLSQGSVSAYADISTIVRFNPAGSIIDARNGGAYAADVPMTFSAGTSYHIRMSVNMAAQTYNVWVTPQGGAEVVLATNYAFRKAATQLDNFIGRMNSTGSVTACNLTFPGAEGEGEGEGEGEQGNVIISNVYPPFIDEGTVVILTAPAGSDWKWMKDGAEIVGATDRELVFDPVKVSDEGSYTVEYNDGTKVIQTTDPFILEVQPEGSVPVAGLAGLALLVGAGALGGVRVIRRRK